MDLPVSDPFGQLKSIWLLLHMSSMYEKWIVVYFLFVCTRINNFMYVYCFVIEQCKLYSLLNFKGKDILQIVNTLRVLFFVAMIKTFITSIKTKVSHA